MCEGKKDWISVCEKGFFHLSVFLFPFSIYGNGSAFFVSLTSGLPMVRQGLRSRQNGRASLLHYPLPSPKSREAERPGSRKAERRKPGKPGGRKGRNADWAEVRPIRRNLVCVYLILPVCHVAIRLAATQKPRGDKNILCSLLIIFQSKLRVCLTPSRVTRNCWRGR